MKNKKLFLTAGFIAFLFIIFPFILPRFQLRMVTEIVIFTLFVQTWRMMLNDGGMFSFGHALYFGLGAYGAALCWIHIPGLSFQSGILIGGIIAAAGAFIIGTCLVRLSGTYMAITTMAFNQLVWAIVWKWRGLTGGMTDWVTFQSLIYGVSR